MADRMGCTTGCTQRRAARAGFTEPEALTDVDVSPPPPGALAALLSRMTSLWQRASGDPFYAVVSYRNYRRLQAAYLEPLMAVYQILHFRRHPNQVRITLFEKVRVPAF